MRKCTMRAVIKNVAQDLLAAGSGEAWIDVKVVHIKCTDTATELQQGKPPESDHMEGNVAELIDKINLHDEAQATLIDVVCISAPNAPVGTSHHLLESALLISSNMSLLNTDNVVM